MRLFLDSSVLLAAAGSSTGASRLLIEECKQQNWNLLSSQYCLEEAHKNLVKVGVEAENAFDEIVAPAVEFCETFLIIDKPFIYNVAKDKPVVATALALQCDALLTLDRADFQDLLGEKFYGMSIVTPGTWVRRWRETST